MWEGRLVDLHLAPHVDQAALFDGALYLLVQSLAVDCLVGVNGVVPLALFAPLEFVGRRDPMSDRQL